MTFHGAGFDLTGGSQALHTLQSLQNIQGNMGNMLLKSYYLGGGGGGAMVMPGYPSTSQSTQVGGGGGVALNSVPGGGVAVNSVPQLMPHLPYPAPAPPPGPAIASTKEKKFRPPARSALKSQRYIPKPIPVELGNLKTYSNPDVLICGNCRELFSDLMDMLDHKKNYCKMRFTCKCETSGESEPNHSCHSSPSAQSGCEDRLEDKNPVKRVCLRCTQCKETFSGAWDLMFHVQNAHSINIYSLGERKKNPSSESDDKDSEDSTSINKISTAGSDSQQSNNKTPSSQQQPNKIPNSFQNPQPGKSHGPQMSVNSGVTPNPHPSPAFNRHHSGFQQKQKFNKHFNNSQKTPTISAPPVLLNM